MQLGVAEQSTKHRLTGNAVEGTDGVDRENRRTWVNLGGGTKHAR